MCRRSSAAPSWLVAPAAEPYIKNAFPTEKVYGPAQDRALRLITCDGDFDAQGHPVNNLVVYATLS